MTPQCGHCGLFCRTYDQYTHFGYGDDLDPPDPIPLCQRCSEAEEEKIVANTKRPDRPYLPWRFGKCHRRALARLGMVVAGPKYAAWAEAHWPDSIPEGFVVWDVAARLVPMEKT